MIAPIRILVRDTCRAVASGGKAFVLLAIFSAISSILPACSASNVDLDYAGMPNRTVVHMGMEYRIQDVPASSKMLITVISPTVQSSESAITSLALSNLSSSGNANCLIVGINLVGNDRWEVQYLCQPVGLR